MLEVFTVEKLLPMFELNVVKDEVIDEGNDKSLEADRLGDDIGTVKLELFGTDTCTVLITLSHSLKISNNRIQPGGASFMAIPS